MVQGREGGGELQGRERKGEDSGRRARLVRGVSSRDSVLGRRTSMWNLSNRGWRRPKGKAMEVVLMMIVYTDIMMSST